MRAMKVLAMLLMTAILSGCKGEASYDLAAALYEHDMAGIQAAAYAGADMDSVFVEGRIQNPVLYIWGNNCKPYLIETLLKSGANPNYTDAQGRTLLMYAAGCQKGYQFSYAYQGISVEDVAHLLLDYGALVDSSDSNGWTAIDYAATTYEYPNIFYLLLEHGATVTAQTLEAAMNTYPDKGPYDYKKVKMLVEMLVETEEISTLNSCVVKAICGLDFPVSEFTTASAKDRTLSLFYTAAFGVDSTLDTILFQGEDPLLCRDPFNQSLLVVAAENGNVQTLDSLLELPWDGEQKDLAQQNDIINAQPEAAKILLEHGAVWNPPIEAWSHSNILLYTADNKDLETLQLLLEYGYPLDEEIVFYTMLEAAQSGGIDFLKFFIDLGYFPDMKGVDPNQGTDLLYAACAFRQMETIKFLIELGVDPRSDSRCLRIAVEQHNMGLISYLLSQGVNPDSVVVYEDGSTSGSPKEIAQRLGMEDVLQLFNP